MKVLTVAMDIAFFGANASPLSAQEAPKGSPSGGKMTEEQMRAKARAIAVGQCKGRQPLNAQLICESNVAENAYKHLKSKQ